MTPVYSDAGRETGWRGTGRELGPTSGRQVGMTYPLRTTVGPEKGVGEGRQTLSCICCDLFGYVKFFYVGVDQL